MTLFELANLPDELLISMVNLENIKTFWSRRILKEIHIIDWMDPFSVPNPFKSEIQRVFRTHERCSIQKLLSTINSNYRSEF
jgi:hypothetical protein